MGPQLVVISELFVAGLHAAVWMFLLITTVIGTEWIDRIEMGDWGFLLGGTALAFVYGLGVLIDRLADSFFHRFDKKIRWEKTEVAPETVARWRLEIVEHSPSLGADLAYMRTKVRLTRAMALNFSLITVFGLMFAIGRTSISESGRGIALLAGGVLMGAAAAALSGWVWARGSGALYKQIRRMHELLLEKAEAT